MTPLMSLKLVEIKFKLFTMNGCCGNCDKVENLLWQDWLTNMALFFLPLLLHLTIAGGLGGQPAPPYIALQQQQVQVDQLLWRQS